MVSKAYLLREWEKAGKGELTPCKATKGMCDVVLA
jgi:hypothetical protein